MCTAATSGASASPTPRAGLLGQGSILTVTSYNDRTSVVQRGKWILENVLGTPPPPPPPNIPPFEATEIRAHDSTADGGAPEEPGVRDVPQPNRPLGFALENFDALASSERPMRTRQVDPSGVLVDGVKFSGPADFRTALMKHQDAFLDTMTAKLLTYALGRGVEPYDMPAVRRIVREAGAAENRWSADTGYRQEHALPDEESGIMIVTKKHISRRTVLRGWAPRSRCPCWTG